MTHQGPGRNQYPRQGPSTRRSPGTPDTPPRYVRKVGGADRDHRHECPDPGQREPAGPAGPGTSATTTPASLDQYPQPPKDPSPPGNRCISCDPLRNGHDSTLSPGATTLAPVQTQAIGPASWPRTGANRATSHPGGMGGPGKRQKARFWAK